jgi:hypothetical protein
VDGAKRLVSTSRTASGAHVVSRAARIGPGPSAGEGALPPLQLPRLPIEPSPTRHPGHKCGLGPTPQIALPCGPHRRECIGQFGRSRVGRFAIFGCCFLSGTTNMERVCISRSAPQFCFHLAHRLDVWPFASAQGAAYPVQRGTGKAPVDWLGARSRLPPLPKPGPSRSVLGGVACPLGLGRSRRNLVAQILRFKSERFLIFAPLMKGGVLACW